MKSISAYLVQIRTAAIKSDIKITGWRIYTVSLIVFLIGLMLENVFYLSPFIRYTSLLILGSMLLVFGLWILAIIYQISQNKYEPYRWSNLAKKAGRYAFPKEDTLINALQIERSESSTTSASLGDAFIQNTAEKLEDINLSILFPSNRIQIWKKITLVALSVTIFTIGFTWRHSISSMYRWTHPKTEFVPPKPFKLVGNTRHVNILGGDEATVVFTAQGEAPDSLYIEFRPIAYSAGNDSIITETIYRLKDKPQYTYEFKDVFQNYRYRAYYTSTEFWEPWDEVSSKYYSISVTDRPSIENFLVTITPPDYTGLAPQTQKANQAEILALNGSNIDVQLRSNQSLAKAELLLDDEKKQMQIQNKSARYSFKVDQDQSFSIHLTDKRGVTNRNPIPFHIQMVRDISPEMTIIQPPPIIELGSEQTIPILMTIEDDFGFSNLQLAYEIQRPTYIQAEPFISMFSINLEDMKKAQQDVQTVWDLKPLGLMPEDEVHFHFELYDNDQITGPKKSISSTYIARLPSLNDLFTAFNEKEDEIVDAMEMELGDIQKLQRQLKKAELDLLKTDKPDWKDQQALKETMEDVKAQLSDFEDLAEQLESLNRSGEKHNLFSEDLMAKFKDLQKLVEEIFPPEMLQNMDWMNEALEKMDPKEMLSVLENLSNNLSQVEQELDRFLDIFKRVKAEQQVDELRKRLEQLVENQDNIDQQIRQTTPQTDPSIFKQLSLEEKMSQRELEDIRDAMEDAAKDVKSFSRSTSRDLETLSDSEMAESSESYLEKTIEHLDDQDPYGAMDQSYAGLQELENMEKAMDDILSDFQKETTQDMAKKFRSILRDMLTLSKSQESLRKETAEMPRNSPRLGDLAGQQQMIQDQLTQTMQNTMDLSKETFLVSPEMGRKMGSAFAQMEAAKGKMAERNGGGSLGNQDQAMLALNEGAKTIIQTVKQMQESGSASGYEEFLKQMEAMANRQQGINNQGMQLALGQMAAAMQESLMGQMLAQQQGVRQSLQQMIDEMQQAGNQGLGDMGGIAKEMDEVIKDLQKRQFTKETSNRQQRILSRMLDSQKSMTTKGFEEERRSETAEQVAWTGPSGMPADLGQRQSLIMNAMNTALKSGYSRDYQNMIRRYFNKLSESEAVLLPDTTQIQSRDGALR